jgi:hypothetical protein
MPDEHTISVHRRTDAIMNELLPHPGLKGEHDVDDNVRRAFRRLANRVAVLELAADDEGAGERG